jgi:hypothetical protein
VSVNINEGGPAFPFREQDGEGGYQRFPGMSLRDYFAAAERIDGQEEWTVQQMELLAGPSPAGGFRSPEWLLWDAKWRAALRYMRADAMLAARERKESSNG